MAEVTVRPMTESEYDQWQHELAIAYAQEQVQAGNWPAEGAYDRARKSDADLLPDGLATQGHLMLIGETGERLIGRLWIGLTHPRGVPDCAFLYDIEVVAGHRGQGLGRALLAAGEVAAREHGAKALELNVFGANKTATELYRSSGYQVTTQQLRKDLTRPSSAAAAADPVRQATVAYERAAFAGDPSALNAAERDLAALEADVSLARAKMAHARFQTGTGDHAEEPELLDRAARSYRRAGDVRGEAEAVCWLGIYHQFVLGDDTAAVPLLERARELSAGAGDDLLTSYVLRHLGIAEHRAGHTESARALLEESTALRRSAGFAAGIASNLVGLIYIAAAEGRHADADAMITEARAAAAGCGAHSILAQVEEAAAAVGPGTA
ncbi:GNAT family N-acetyltransferase [Actinoplanes sp. NEAU-A12]|uniref:GNAT family N-acetyltransferase n=1 Tax=Actinoplanes sandaracinus TaxID=3045177 RepID=A0ABT6WRN5_9ACTN|nr:GNAT family N-acetyltransferase [Actinoplanes sandaracinus]MDI6102398.1 GNAT family N-acetyltransferase [Actinoplanes sandaracinus]